MNQRCYENDKNVRECPIENVCDKYIFHDVDHYVPIHTQIIKHHIYRHSFKPVFSTSVCDVCENYYDCCMK